MTYNKNREANHKQLPPRQRKKYQPCSTKRAFSNKNYDCDKNNNFSIQLEVMNYALNTLYD